MRIKHVFLVCCLFGAVFTNLHSQNSSSNSYWRTDQSHIKVFCNGEVIDIVTGTAELHYLLTPNNTDLFIHILQVHIKGESLFTGESFKYVETNNYRINQSESIWRYHLIGSAGSKYYGIITINRVTGEIDFGEECYVIAYAFPYPGD